MKETHRTILSKLFSKIGLYFISKERVINQETIPNSKPFSRRWYLKLLLYSCSFTFAWAVPLPLTLVDVFWIVEPMQYPKRKHDFTHFFFPGGQAFKLWGKKKKKVSFFCSLWRVKNYNVLLCRIAWAHSLKALKFHFCFTKGGFLGFSPHHNSMQFNRIHPAGHEIPNRSGETLNCCDFTFY